MKDGPAPARRGTGAGRAPEPGAIALRPSAAPHGSPARRPPSPRNPPECRARLSPRDRHPGPLAGPPRSERRGKRPGARLQLRLLPRPSCAVCVRESLPSPLNSFLPSPPHNMAARSLLTAARKGRARAPAHPPPSAPHRPRLRARRAPLPIGRAAPSPPGPSARTASIGRAAPSFDLPTPGPRAPWPRSPIGRPRRRSPASAPAAEPPLAPTRLLAPPPRPAGRGLAPRPHKSRLRGRRAAGKRGVCSERPPRRRPWALLSPPPRPHLAGASPAPPRLISAVTPLGLSTAFPSSPRFRNLVHTSACPRRPSTACTDLHWGSPP